MTPIDNAGLLNINYSLMIAGFKPAGTYAYNVGAKTITVTDTTVFDTDDADDDIQIIHVHVSDVMGGKLYGHIDAAAGNVVIDTSTLNPIGGYNVLVTFVTTKRYVADASAYQVGSAAPVSGPMSFVNKQNC